jgi:hypothetical protein
MVDLFAIVGLGIELSAAKAAAWRYISLDIHQFSRLKISSSISSFLMAMGGHGRSLLGHSFAAGMLSMERRGCAVY